MGDEPLSYTAGTVAGHSGVADTGPGGARQPRPGWRAVVASKQKLDRVLGGPARSRLVLLFAGVLALSSADSSTVGASAAELRQGLHISNADIGLLVAASAGVGAVASLPFGILVDRIRRTTLLTVTVVLWGLAMVASAMVSTFGQLILVRLALGCVTAVAGPAVASLVGDTFPSEERGRIYGFILTGELLGAGVGFFITGDVAALSWRAAFVILAIPAFVLAWLLRRVPEPPRGAGEVGARPLTAVGASGSQQPAVTDTQQRVLASGIRPDPDRVLRRDPREMGVIAAARYVLRVPTNVILVLSSASAYFFMTGVQTFGLEFVRKQYGVATVLANLLMLVVGAGAVLGVLLGGLAGDALVARGRVNGRMLVAGIAATATALLFLPPLLTDSAVAALPYITIAAFCLTAQNPTLDAARLDIMPPLLWGRAEGIRTLLRSATQSLAPITFGGLSDLLRGTGQGLRLTFLVMLLPLLASGVILLRGLRHYPTDVATAAASATAGAAGAVSQL